MFKKTFLVLFSMFILLGVGCSIFESRDKKPLDLTDNAYDAGGELDAEDMKIVPNIDVIVSDKIKIKSIENYEKSIYVYVKNNTEEYLDFKNELEAQFTALGFEIVQKPSMAEYIMFLDIIALGQASIEKISKAALDPDNLGLDLIGSDAYFLMFDLVLVLRSHPKGNKPNNTVIRLSSERSVKAHNKLRFALIYKSEIRPKNRVFGHVLVSEVVALAKDGFQ